MDYPCVKEFARTGPMLPPVPPVQCGPAGGPVWHVPGEVPMAGSGAPGQLSDRAVQCPPHPATQARARRGDVSLHRKRPADYGRLRYALHRRAGGCGWQLARRGHGGVVYLRLSECFARQAQGAGGDLSSAAHGALPVADPWGRKLDLARLGPKELTALLGDPRPKGARSGGGAPGEARCGSSAGTVRGGSGQVRPNPGGQAGPLWALCRIRGGGPRSRS